jgi:hypothetical protein
MDALTIPGTVLGAALRFTPPEDGKPAMTVEGLFAGQYTTVLLSADWLLPLAAWFAGEAQPAALGDRPGTLYGASLAVHGDETATVWNTYTWARLECLTPYGDARVAIGPRGKEYGTSVLLPPEGRQSAAAWLRRTDAEDWTPRTATA